MMRILIVATDILVPDHHGGSTHVQELADHLRAHGETLLLARRGSSHRGVAAIGREMRRSPAILRHLDAVRSFPEALAVARNFRPDVIYERCTSYGLGAMLSLALDRPLLAMVLDHRYSWLSLLRARRLIATCIDIIPAAVRGRAVTVRWGANPALFDASLSRTEARDRLALRNESFVVAYSGSFRPWHGVRCIVQAAARLRDRDIDYLLVGDGPEREKVEREAAELGLHDRFHFTGAIDYELVPGALAAADVCVAPFEPDELGSTRKHGFTLDPLKLFEYLALGKPAVTIRAANIETMFEHGKHLLLVAPGDAVDLADAIARLMDEPELAEALALAGRDVVLRQYSWDAHASQLAGMFAGMMAERAA